MHSARRKIMRLLLYSDLLMSRFSLGAAEICWSLLLLAPGNTFDRQTYAMLKNSGISEELWGVVWLITGITQLYILFSDRHHSLFAVCFAGYNMILWWYVVIGCFLSVSAPAAMSAEFVNCLIASAIYIRSGWLPLPEGELYVSATK